MRPSRSTSAGHAGVIPRSRRPRRYGRARAHSPWNRPPTDRQLRPQASAPTRRCRANRGDHGARAGSASHRLADEPGVLGDLATEHDMFAHADACGKRLHWFGSRPPLRPRWVSLVLVDRAAAGQPHRALVDLWPAGQAHRVGPPASGGDGAAQLDPRKGSTDRTRRARRASTGSPASRKLAPITSAIAAVAPCLVPFATSTRSASPIR